MISGEFRNKIDNLWTEFWTGGITNPLTVIEQISYLMFARLLDGSETLNEKCAQHTGKPFVSLFTPYTDIKVEGEVIDPQQLRWSRFKEMGADRMLPLVRDGVFPHFKMIAQNGNGDENGNKTKENSGKSNGQDAKLGVYMKDAQLMIQKPSLLVSAVKMIDSLPLTQGDTKGDLYEYLLGKLTTAGINGQFRTPRHIIRLMVEMAAPKPTDVIGDPACGTAGFLVAAVEYLWRTYTSPEGVFEHADGQKNYSGDLLEPHLEHIHNRMFHGFDFDSTMLRIAAMNLLLHGIDAPNIHYQDTLSTSFPDNFPAHTENGYNLILANPPFKGNLDYEDVQPALLRQVKTKKTELLFVALILRMLKLGGRSATIVPDGVLFGASNAHVALRKLLVEENQLEAVISLPSGVFKPYAGVSTAILIFTKGGATENVFFYDVQADGFSLDDKREKVDANDLPDVLARWQNRDPDKDTDRTAKWFFVPKTEIKANKYDLSINRYKEIVYEEEEYDPPREILSRMKNLEKEILRDIDELEGMLG